MHEVVGRGDESLFVGGGCEVVLRGDAWDGDGDGESTITGTCVRSVSMRYVSDEVGAGEVSVSFRILNHGARKKE